MTRPSRADAKQSNRDALLQAAREVIIKEGAAASLLSIAAAADLTTGAIYSIFGSKQDLLGALLMEDVDDGMAQIPELTDPDLAVPGVLVRCADAWLLHYQDDFFNQGTFELQVVLAASQDTRLRDKIATAMRTEVDQLAELLTDRPVTAEPGARRTTAAQARQLSAALKATMSGFAFRYLIMREELPAAMVRDTCLALAALVGD